MVVFVFYHSIFFPLLCLFPAALSVWGMSTHKYKSEMEERVLTWSLRLSPGVNQRIFFQDGSSQPGAQAVMSLFIIPRLVSVIENWLEV